MVSNSSPPLFMYGQVWDESLTKRTDPEPFSGGYDPTTTLDSPNMVVIYNVENQVLSRSDRAGNAGTFRQSEGDVQRALIENPAAQNNTASGGLLMDVRDGKTYDGTVITAKIEWYEEGGDDPVGYKIPRRAYVSAANGDSAPTANVTLGVSGDFGKNVLIDSGTLKYNVEFVAEDVWWQPANNLEGQRMAYFLENRDSADLIVEGISAEFHQRGRR